MTEIEVNLSNMKFLADRLRFKNRIEIRKRGNPVKTIRSVELVGFVPGKQTGMYSSVSSRYPRLLFRIEMFWFDESTGKLGKETRNVGNGGRIYAEIKKM